MRDRGLRVVSRAVAKQSPGRGSRDLSAPESEPPARECGAAHMAHAGSRTATWKMWRPSPSSRSASSSRQSEPGGDHRRSGPHWPVAFGLVSLGAFVHIAGFNTHIPGPWALARYLPLVRLARTPARLAVVPHARRLRALRRRDLRLGDRWPHRRRLFLANTHSLCCCSSCCRCRARSIRPPSRRCTSGSRRLPASNWCWNSP